MQLNHLMVITHAHTLQSIVFITTHLHHNYSAVTGAALPLISVILMWRLTVILPEFYTEDILEKLGIDMPVLDFEMQDRSGHEEDQSEVSRAEVENPVVEEEVDGRGNVMTSGMGGYVFY